MAMKLQNFRQKANMSREQLATHTDISYASICRYEQMKSEMSLKTAKKFSRLFAKHLKKYSAEEILEHLAQSHCP